MGRQSHRAVVSFLVCSAAIVSLIPFAAAATVASTHLSAVSPKLVGQWTRTVTKADVQREEAFPSLAGEHCTLTIKTSGAAHIVCPGPAPVNFSGPITAKGGNRVQISLGDTYPNAYRWRVAGRVLTLTKLKDLTADRAAAMSGVWRRK